MLTVAAREDADEHDTPAKRRRLNPLPDEQSSQKQPGDDPAVTLNVGGSRLQARLSSLTRRSRYFHNIYNGPFAHRDRNDELFIDTDPKLFRHVLHFLRRGRVEAKAPLEALEHEARVYGIDELEEEARRQRIRGQLVGTWTYARNNHEHFGFFISAEGDSLLYQEIDASEEPPVILQGELVEDSDGKSPPFFTATLFKPCGQLFGMIRMRVCGAILTFNCRHVDRPPATSAGARVDEAVDRGAPSFSNTGLSEEEGSTSADLESLQWSRDSYAHRATATAQVYCEHLPE